MNPEFFASLSTKATARKGAAWGLLSAIALGLVACESTEDLGRHSTAEFADGGAADSGDAGTNSDASVAVDSGHRGKIVFVTDNRYTGDLATEGGTSSGLDGADAICNGEAQAAGIGGVFKAWLSSSSENAKARIAAVGPWHMVDGSVVFPGKAVIGAPLLYPRYTASGVELFADSDPSLWTGTNSDGTVADAKSTCADWTSNSASGRGGIGFALSTTGEWTDYAGMFSTSPPPPCSVREHLYCFEQ